MFVLLVSVINFVVGTIITSSCKNRKNFYILLFMCLNDIFVRSKIGKLYYKITFGDEI